MVDHSSRWGYGADWPADDIVIPSSALPQDYSVDVTGGQVVSPILVNVNVDNGASVRVHAKRGGA